MTSSRDGTSRTTLSAIAHDAESTQWPSSITSTSGAVRGASRTIAVRRRRVFSPRNSGSIPAVRSDSSTWVETMVARRPFRSARHGSAVDELEELVLGFDPFATEQLAQHRPPGVEGCCLFDLLAGGGDDRRAEQLGLFDEVGQETGLADARGALDEDCAALAGVELSQTGGDDACVPCPGRPDHHR